MRRSSRRFFISFLLFVMSACPLIERTAALNPSASPNKTDLADLGRPAFRTFSNADGLPQSSVNTMTVDSRGYFWIGTQDGAAVFNGRTWKTVNMPNRTRSNNVRAVLASADGSVWFGTNGGGVLNLKDEKWTVHTAGSGLPDNQIRCLAETASPGGGRALWVGTRRGLARFEAGTWTVLDAKSGDLPNDLVLCLLETGLSSERPALLVGTAGGLARLENGRRTIPAALNDGLPSRFVVSLLETVSPSGAALWVGTLGGGLVRFENGQRKVYDIASGDLPANDVFSLAETKSANGHSTVWVGTDGGGLVRLEGNRRIVHASRLGLPNDSILSLCKTGSLAGAETLWIGTNGGGLTKLEQGGWTAFDTGTGLPDNVVTCFLESSLPFGSPTLWIGTDAGLSQFDGSRWKTFDSKSGLPDNSVTCLLETVLPSGNPALWVGTNAGPAVYDGKRWRSAASISFPSADFGVLSLLETVSSSGTRTIWVGTRGGGLARYENEGWTVFNTDSGLPNNLVTCLAETKSADGRPVLWAGTYGGGLARLDQGRWTVLDARSGLPNDSIWALHPSTAPSGKPVLWIGTEGGGCARLDVSESNAVPVPLADEIKAEIPNETVYRVCEDARRRMYLATNKGVVRLTPRAAGEPGGEYRVEVFTDEDGLPSNECNFGASLTDRLGRVWIGTVAGAAMLDTSLEMADSSPKPLRLERLSVNDGVFPFPDPSRFPPNGFAHDENTMAFEYALLDFSHSGETRYRTLLVGFDRQPSAWTTDAKKEYTNLPAGRYVFRVWAKDHLGTISGPTELAFTVRPAPWLTWWAFALYATVAVAVVGGSVHLRVKAVSERNRLLEAKIRERTTELAEAVRETEQKNDELRVAHEHMKSAKADAEAKNRALDQKVAELIEAQKRADRIFSAYADALPGKILDGRYRLDLIIGRGGFGAVFKATQLNLNREVAVKVFRPRPGNDSTEAVERFRLEGMAACRVLHPNAVSILDSGLSTEGIAYLVMELLEGHSLARELREGGGLSVRRTLDILIPVSEALAAAHALGIIHRDIKPENIFLHRGPDRETVKVVDFGIAKVIDNLSDSTLQNLTNTGEILGTPKYMSPECLAGLPFDGRADVYGLGVTAYEMLTGHHPFPSSGKTGADGLLMKLKGEWTPLRQYNPEIPVGIEDIVSNMLAKNPEDRPTAAEAARQLIDAASGLGWISVSAEFKRVSVPASETPILETARTPARRDTVEDSGTWSSEKFAP